MSKALTAQIAQHIQAANGGWISFDTFMQQALYAPGLGYYETREVFGREGDFLTGPDTGPWLSLGLADLIEWGWNELGRPSEWSLVEQGGGSGRLLADVLALLSGRDIVMPQHIHAVERSGQMRERQKQAYAMSGVSVQQHASLAELHEVDNLMYFSNELPDAFPVRCFIRQGTLRERGVGLDEDGDFCWRDMPAEAPGSLPAISTGVVQQWPEGYFSEWNPHLSGWQADVSRIMRRGFVFSVDYGFSQTEYYRPHRVEGTLLGHLKHQPVHDVLSDPGSRDITAHVDFTAMGRAGRDAGLSMQCWITQGAWLAQSPSLQACIRQAAMQNTAESMALMGGAKRMLLPQGMGELFKLCVQCKGMGDAAPAYLERFNRMHALGLDDA